MEAISVWRDIGVLDYLLPFLILFTLIFIILFIVINKNISLKKRGPKRTFIITLVSNVIAYILASLFLQSYFVIESFFYIFGNSEVILFFIVSGLGLISIVLGLAMLLDAVSKKSSDDKVFYILTILLGGFMGGWIYYFTLRKK